METNNSMPEISEAQWWVWREVKNIARNPVRRREAIAMAEQALAVPGALLESEIPGVKRARDQWLWSLDPDFRPSQYSRIDAVKVLEIKTWDCIHSGDFNSALQHAWERWQYSEPGTTYFCYALSDLADCAAIAGKVMLARHIAQMYQAHYDVLHTAIIDDNTPVGFHEIVNRKNLPGELKPVFFRIPTIAALHGMVSDPHGCWVWILELAVYKVPFRKGRYEARLQKAAAALVTYYTQTGDTEALDRLNAYLTETQPE